MSKAKRLPNIQPGEILEEEFLQPNRITRYRLAKDIGVPRTRVAEICSGTRAITADTALRLAACFGVSAKFRLGQEAVVTASSFSSGSFSAVWGQQRYRRWTAA